MNGIVALSVKRRVSVLMVALAVVAFGVVSLSRLTLNLMPDVAYPTLTVQTAFPDAAPGEVENLVTRPVEEVVGVLKGLREMHSVSRAGQSEVTLEFEWGSDMDVLSMDIREKLDRLILPDEVESPIVLRYDPALDPIMRIALSGTASLSEMRFLAEEEVKVELEKVQGVAAAQLKGGEEEEIQVNLDQGKLAGLGLSLEDVASVIAQANINSPGGSLKTRESQYLVRTLNEYDSVEEIGEVMITPRDAVPVRLTDVAQVVRGAKDREEIARVNGQECVVIEVFKEADANTVNVAASVQAALDWLNPSLPSDMQLTLLFSQARFIRQAIDEVRDALLMGGLLAVLVLYLFLRDFRSTYIIATSIPLSVVATFIFMYLSGISLNIMSLGGLTLGIGMLVDSSIVVLESIHRRRELGETRAVAAVKGTREVSGAVTASILTTIAVFFPIVFVQGVAGQMFRDQALTVTLSLLASLVVALTLIPMLASLGRDRRKSTGDPSAGFYKSRFARAYEVLLRGALRWKGLTLLTALLVFGVSLLLVEKLGRELIPSLHQGEFFVEVTMPEGASLEATNRVMLEMERLAREQPGVRDLHATVGTRNVSGGVSLKTKDENLGQLNVVMEDRRDNQQMDRVTRALRKAYHQIPDLQTKMGSPALFSLKTPVEIILFGDDLEQLRTYALSLKPMLEEVNGLVELKSSLESGNPELSVVFDREKLSRYGLSVRGVSETLRSRVNGTVVSTYKEEDRLIDIRVRNQISDREKVQDIENTVVAQVGSRSLPLTALAVVKPDRGPAEIHRVEQSRAAILTAEVSGRSLGIVIADIEQILNDNPPPRGIEAPVLGGQNREMEVSFASLQFALLLAVFLVYLVMAGTFENMLHPFIILFTIPLALVGVIISLYLSGHTISVISFIGVIFLAGVVVNNAIVLVDAINRARRRGMEKRDAVVHACMIRVRPIIITTLTTILGLLPMTLGLGEGSELRQPMALVVSAGLLVSTLLTLVVIPAAYALVPSRVRTEQEDRDLEAQLAQAPDQTGESPLTSGGTA